MLELPIALVALTVPVCQAAAPPAARERAQAPLVVERTIALPGVAGRIDHLALDPGRERLWVAALGNDTVEVVDLARGSVAASLAASEPQGILFLAELDRVAFTNGRTGTLDVHDAGTLERVARVEVGGDADNLRWDADAQRLLVAIEGGLAVVDGATWKVAGTIAFAGHAESFQLDARGARAFVNVPGERDLVEVDVARRRVVRHVAIDAARANYPMAWLPAKDTAPELLLLGCREPATLLVRSAVDGSALGAVELSGDTDDVFCDEKRGRVYVSCGAGSVDVLARAGSELRPLARVPTADGARTCLWVPERDRLFVAVPHRGEQRAEVMILAPRD